MPRRVSFFPFYSGKVSMCHCHPRNSGCVFSLSLSPSPFSFLLSFPVLPLIRAAPIFKGGKRRKNLSYIPRDSREGERRACIVVNTASSPRRGKWGKRRKRKRDGKRGGEGVGWMNKMGWVGKVRRGGGGGLTAVDLVVVGMVSASVLLCSFTG